MELAEQHSLPHKINLLLRIFVIRLDTSKSCQKLNIAKRFLDSAGAVEIAGASHVVMISHAPEVAAMIERAASTP